MNVYVTKDIQSYIIMWMMETKDSDIVTEIRLLQNKGLKIEDQNHTND